MRVDIVGYNRFDYTNKNGERKSAVKFYCNEAVPSDKITYGYRVFEVFSSVSYADKIISAFESNSDIHIGWSEKDKRAFLYVSK